MQSSAAAMLLALLLAWPAMGAAKPSEDAEVDKVMVYKSQRLMDLMKDGKVVRTYHIALGDEPVGKKTQQGDEKTPEGNYTIDHHNPNSGYHKSLHISYPNKEDREGAAARGVSPGGDIMIHGLPNKLPDFLPGTLIPDWTDGCIALRNAEVDEVYKMVKDGTPIEILP